MGVMGTVDGMEVVEVLEVVGVTVAEAVASEDMEAALASNQAGVLCTAPMATNLQLVNHATTVPHLTTGGSHAPNAHIGGTQV